MNHNTKVQPHILKRFDLLKKIGSGAYGHVWKVQQKSTKNIFALKKIFDAFQHSTDAQRTYRQINILKQLNHNNIIKLKQTIKADNLKDIYLVFQFMEADLHNVISEGILKVVHNKYIIYQIAKSLKYLHSAKLIHRDLKPSNILLNSNCLVKICDFGLVRCITTEQTVNNVMTQGVATRWYRAPQVLLGSKNYQYPADIWSFGCIIYEIFSGKPLFDGNSTLQQLQKIIRFTGFPENDDINSLQSDFARTMVNETKLFNCKSNIASFLKDLQEDVRDLLQNIILFNPHKRFTIEQILSHSLLKQFRKIQEQKICSTQIKTDLDDNTKLGVEDYRQNLYKSHSMKKSGHFIPNKKTCYQIKKQKNSQEIVNKSSQITKKPINKNNSTAILKNIKSSDYIVNKIPSKVQSLAISPNQSKTHLTKPIQNKTVFNQTCSNINNKNIKIQANSGGSKDQLKTYLNQLNFNDTISPKSTYKPLLIKKGEKQNSTTASTMIISKNNNLTLKNDLISPKNALQKSSKIGFTSMNKLK